MGLIESFLPYVITTLVVMLPASEILRKAGYSRWWVLLLLIPLVNFIGLFLFAFSQWPILKQRNRRKQFD